MARDLVKRESDIKLTVSVGGERRGHSAKGSTMVRAPPPSRAIKRAKILALAKVTFIRVEIVWKIS